MLKSKLFKHILPLISCVALFSSGFASFLINIGVKSAETAGDISVGDFYEDSSLTDDAITLSFKRSYNKNDFLSNTDFDSVDSFSYDKFNAKFSWKNNQTNPLYPGELTDYFDLYDKKFPASKQSPYAINIETNETIYFENHFSYDSSLTSSLYYQSTYDYVDFSNKTFDQNEIDRQMEIVKKLISPMNEYEVETAELSIQENFNYNGNATYYKYDYQTGGLKIIGSRTTKDGKTYEYRYHFFYHIKNSQELFRVDSSIGTSATDNSNSTTWPTITLTRGDNSNQRTYKKRVSRSMTYQSSFSPTSNKSIVLNQFKFDNNAGKDSNFPVPNVNKTYDDFSPRFDEIKEFIKKFSFNVNPTVANSEIEYITQSDENSNITNNFPWFYVFASRYKVTSGNTTYYRNYHYYVFYFDSFSGRLCMIGNINSSNGLVSGNYTSENRPLFELLSNNVESHKFANGNVMSSSSFTPFNKFSIGYIRYVYSYFDNNGNNSTNSTDVFYFASDYYNEIDKSKVQTDFNTEILINYLKASNTYHKNLLSGESLEFKEYEDPSFPYLKIIQSRRKTADNKYYNFITNIFYYCVGDNSSNSSQATLNQIRKQTNASEATSNNEWFSIKFHSEIADSYPSYIASDNHAKTTTIYYDINYFDKNNQEKSLTNQSQSIIGNSYGYLAMVDDGGLPDDEFSKRNILNTYIIKNNIDMNRKHSFNSYIDDDGYYRFSGFYYLENRNAKTYFDNKYSFSNASLYNRFYSGASATESAPNYFLKASDYNKELFCWNDKLIYLSQYESPLLEFCNDSGDFIYLLTPGQGNKTKSQAKFIFDRVNSNTLTFYYKITLSPKKDEYKTQLKEILSCFDIDVELYMNKELINYA